MQKNLKKAPNIRPMRQFLKIDHLAKGTAHAKATAFAKWSACLKIQKCQKYAKTILKEHYSCSVQKTARKNNKYSRNETMEQISHLTKAIAHAKAIAYTKCLDWVKNLKCQKHAKNHFTRTMQFFCTKKLLEKKT